VQHSWFGWLIAGLWFAWLAYWVVAARTVKADRRRQSRRSRLIQLGPMILGATLLTMPNLPASWLYERFVPQTYFASWIGVILLGLGLGLAVWARRHLGSNWSGIVTQKHGHELIRSGPYRCVRHPIYSGLLLAMLGTAIAVGQWRALIGFPLIAMSLLLRLRTEERFMDETFGSEYASYRAEVPALIPRFIRRAHG